MRLKLPQLKAVVYPPPFLHSSRGWTIRLPRERPLWIWVGYAEACAPSHWAPPRLECWVGSLEIQPMWSRLAMGVGCSTPLSPCELWRASVFSSWITFACLTPIYFIGVLCVDAPSSRKPSWYTSCIHLGCMPFPNQSSPPLPTPGLFLPVSICLSMSPSP